MVEIKIPSVVYDPLFQSWTQLRPWSEAGHLWLRNNCFQEQKQVFQGYALNRVVPAGPGGHLRVRQMLQAWLEMPGSSGPREAGLVGLVMPPRC